MVDKLLVLRKFAEMEGYLDQLREFSNITQKEYAGDWKVQRIVERTFQITIEICVDIANHIIADRRYRVPLSYADTFKVLHEEGVLDLELSTAIEKMSKFRNILVHHYDKVDESIVVDILHSHLDDFLRYRDAVLAFIEN